MSRRFRPYRRMRSEILPLAIVLAVPLLLASVFPRARLFNASSAPSVPAVASCAFVTMTPAVERKALASSRTSWQAERRATDAQRIDMVTGSLPPPSPRPVLEDVRVLREKPLRAATCHVPNLLPASLAAQPPASIAPQGEGSEAAPFFSREELLKVKW